MKNGVKEAVDEILVQIQQEELNKTNIVKNTAFFTGICFLGYFIFVLPTNPESLTQYNWFNQDLIEIKINLINLITGGGDNSGGAGVGSVGGTDGIGAGIDLISRTSSNTSTITPSVINVGTQTNINSIQVSKAMAAVTIFDGTLPEEVKDLAREMVNDKVKNITD